MLRGPRGAAEMRRNRSQVEWLLVVPCHTHTHTHTGRCEGTEFVCVCMSRLRSVCLWELWLHPTHTTGARRCLKSPGYETNRD